MRKEIILLAKSKKFGNYCIAGIEPKTGKWIRIISDDEDSQNAVSASDIKYENGKIPEILDIIKIKCKGYCPNNYQPENFIFDPEFFWKKIGKAQINDLASNLDTEHQEIVYNTAKKVCDDEIDKVSYEKRYSLILIQPMHVKIHVKQWPEKESKTINASFRYNNQSYKYIGITDLDALNYFKSQEEGTYSIKDNLLFVMSLADAYSKDNCHYKLIANILWMSS